MGRGAGPDDRASCASRCARPTPASRRRAFGHPFQGDAGIASRGEDLKLALATIHGIQTSDFWLRVGTHALQDRQPLVESVRTRWFCRVCRSPPALISVRAACRAWVYPAHLPCARRCASLVARAASGRSSEVSKTTAIVACSTLQTHATHCSTLQHGSAHYTALQHGATRCNTGHGSSGKATTNFGANRDLNGRRLRHVEQEKEARRVGACVCIDVSMYMRSNAPSMHTHALAHTRACARACSSRNGSCSRPSARR